MTIATLDQYIASTKQIIPIAKATTRTTVASGWFTMFDIAGNPGAGTLAGSSTAAGVVPTDATAGFSPISFSTGTGYLTTVDFANTVASRLMLCDVVFKAGAYAYNSGTTNLSSQPSYSSRMPGGDYNGTQIWIQVSTAFSTGTTWHVECTYTDQSGNTGATTATMSNTTAANLTLGRMYQLALASGDSGVQKIESVVVTTGGMTAGAFNVLVLRPLWAGRVGAVNSGDCHGLDRTGMPIVFNDSAIGMYVCPDSTSSGQPEVTFEIASA